MLEVLFIRFGLCDIDIYKRVGDNLMGVFICRSVCGVWGWIMLWFVVFLVVVILYVFV